jgi:hypothetical protein
LPTGAGEDASPLALRTVGAAEDGQNATHGGWRCGGEEQVSAGVDEAERVRETRVLEKKREMRRLAGDRTVFIADPCGSGASRLRTAGTRGGCRLGGFRARREFILSGCRTAESAWARACVSW